MVAFQAGVIGDAAGFGRVFLGIAGFLVVVFLPDPEKGGDGEESSMRTNLATTLSRLDCCLEQHQGQSETPFLVFTDPSGHIL